MLHGIEGKPQKFYGSVTVGERGQVAIPAAARRDLDIVPNTKLLVFGSPGKHALMLMKAESVAEFITNATDKLARFEQLLKNDSAENPEGGC
jgi:AbrB family looped-hinge helix DNA binding protein